MSTNAQKNLKEMFLIDEDLKEGKVGLHCKGVAVCVWFLLQGEVGDTAVQVTLM